MKKFKVIVALTLVLSMITAGAVLKINAAETPTFAFNSASANAGEEVSLTLTCSNNPGINGWAVNIAYDSSAMEIVSADKASAFGDVTVSQNLSENPFRAQWFGLNDVTANGKMVGLTFKINENAKSGDYSVSISYNEDEVVNLNEENVHFDTVDAVITVTGATEPSLPHTHNMAKIEAKAATCTEKGNNEYFYCPDCKKYFKDSEGKTETAVDAETIPAKGHTPGAAVKENEVKPGCVTEGSYDEVVYCTVCKAEISRDKKTIAATGHDWGEWVVTKEATETEKGSKTRTCKNDPSHTETVDIPVLTHVHTLTVVEGKPATCTEDGVKTYYKCESCGKMFEDATANVEITSEADLVIPKTGHTPSDWIIDKEATAAEKGHRHKVCTVCNETVAEEDYEYVEPTTAAPTTVAPTTETPTATVEPGTTAAPATTVAPTAQPTTAKPKASGDTATPSNANTNSNGTVKTGESSTVFFLFAGIVLLAAAASTVYFIKKRRESN